MSKIKGIYSEKSIKKAKKKKEEVLRKAQKESREFTIKCNHRDAESGKSKLRQTEDGNFYCKICGAEIIGDSDIMNAENIRESANVLISLISTVRHELDMSSDLNKQLVKTALMIDDLEDLYDKLKKEADKFEKQDRKDNKGKGKGHKGGKGKNKNHKGGKNKRIKY